MVREDAGLGCTLFARDLEVGAGPTLVEVNAPTKTKESEADDAVLADVYRQLRHAIELVKLDDRLARAFFKSKGAEWNPVLYSVMPTGAEECRVLERVSFDRVARDATIPGLSRRNGRWSFARARADPDHAYIEWVLNAEGFPIGFGVRFLAPAKPKMKAYGRHRPHFSLGWNSGSVMYVTEGRRKANEIARFLGKGAVGFPGVNIGKPPALELIHAIHEKRDKIRTVVMAADFADLVDRDRDDQVRAAVLRDWRWLADRLEAIGLEVLWCAWDPSHGKGLDDVLAFGHGVGRLLDWDEYLSNWTWREMPVGLSVPPADPWPGLDADARPVRNIEEAAAAVTAHAELWEPGQQSLALASFPGCGKTTAFGRDQLGRLHRGEHAAAILALPRRADVYEKAAALQRYAQQHGLAVEVVEWTGAAPNESEPFYCEKPRRRNARAKDGRWGCEGCPSYATCLTEKGRFRHDTRVVRERLEAATEASPVLIVTTVEKLRYEIERVPFETPIVLDDSGWAFGLLHEVTIDEIDVAVAADHVRDYASSADQNVAGEELERVTSGLAAFVPDVVVAGLVCDLLDAMTHDADPVAAFDAAVDRIPEPLANVIRRREVVAPRIPHPLKAGVFIARWPWEEWSDDDGPDRRPTLTTVVLDLVRCALLGYRPSLPILKGKSMVRVPNVELLDRAKAGWLAWLSVGRMPEAVSEWLGARRVEIAADPERLTTVAISGRVFGRQDDGLVAGVFAAIQNRINDRPVELHGEIYNTVGGILRKGCREQLEDTGQTKHYGDGHAATDELAGVDLLVVSRFELPRQVLREHAQAWRRCLGLGGAGCGGMERPRGWGGRRERRKIWVPNDSLTRDVAEFHERHWQLNAVGRCRPLSAGRPKMVILLAGYPFGGVRVDRVPSLCDLEIDFRMTMPDVSRGWADALEERRAIREADRHGRVVSAYEGYFRLHGERPSERTLEALTGIPKSTLHRDLKKLRHELEEVELRIAGTASGATSPVHIAKSCYLLLRGLWTTTVAPPEWPTAAEVLDRVDVKMHTRTAQRHLARIRGSFEADRLLLPERSDTRRGFAAVCVAVESLIRERLAPEPLQRDFTAVQVASGQVVRVGESKCPETDEAMSGLSRRDPGSWQATA